MLDIQRIFVALAKTYVYKAILISDKRVSIKKNYFIFTFPMSIIIGKIAPAFKPLQCLLKTLKLFKIYLI